MDATRLLLIGDLHIRAGEQLDDVRSCLEWAAQLAEPAAVHGVLIAGDAYEGRSTPVERGVLADFLGGVAGPSRSALVIRGNHDQMEDLAVFDGYQGVEVFERPGWAAVGPVDILCVPWPERAFLAGHGLAGESGEAAGSAALAAMLRGLMAAQPRPGHPVVVLAHLQVLGAIASSAQPLIGKAIEVTLGDLKDLGASFVALGHVHKPQQLADGIEYIGSLTVHDFGEEGEDKRVGILTVEADGESSVEWLRVPCRRWMTIDATVSDGRVVETAAADIAGANVRYRYSCSDADEHLFDDAEIRRRFAAAQALKIVPQVERAARVRAAEVAAAKTPTEKLLVWGAATGTEITPSLLSKLEEMEVQHD